MERAAPILRINARDRNGKAAQRIDPFHDPVPFSGILAVGGDEFIHREMLVRAVPVHIGVRGEKCSDSPARPAREPPARRLLYPCRTSPYNSYIIYGNDRIAAHFPDFRKPVLPIMDPNRLSSQNFICGTPHLRCAALCGGDHSHRKTRESAVSFAVLPDKRENFTLRVRVFLFLFLNVQHGQHAV